MTGNLQFKRGLKSNLPTSAPSGMPLWCTDKNELYMGTGNCVVKVGVQNIKNLDYSSQISLESNTIYKINVSNTIKFILPTVNNNVEFNQILLQIYMPNIVSIDLGTETFFNGKTPILNKIGTYNIIYEYDVELSEWVCGVLYKGVPEE